MSVTKIRHINPTDSIDGEASYSVKRKASFGRAFLAFLVSSAVLAASTSQMAKQEKEEIDAMVPPFTIEASIDEINDMNIILNDDDCSDTFFEDVVGHLKEDGLEFTVTSNCHDINQNNSTVITLDQQYSAGPGTVIFAPYDNAMVGHSDSLALSMQAAFEQNGFIADEISCGQIGYEVDEDGTIHSVVPTDTEREMDPGNDSSFVTISFGTDNQNAEWVAKSIENGLARQNHYLKTDDSQTDLIYRANPNDSLEDVANYFGTDSERLSEFNQMDGTMFYEGQTVVNPDVGNMKSFDTHGMFQMGEVKTRAY